MEVPDVSSRSPDGLRSVPGPSPDPDGAFEALYRTEWSGLVALGWSLTGSWALAEELAQEAFVDAHRRWGEVARKDRPGAWVRRAVVNRAASHHRHRAVEARGLARWSRRHAPDEPPGTDSTGVAATDSVGDPRFWDAVRSLPHQQRAAVALHYLEDRPVAEIAPILGCSTSTVKVHLHRGRLALARRLTDEADAADPTRTRQDPDEATPTTAPGREA